MKASRRSFHSAGYTLVEVLVAAGVISAAIGAASALSMSMAGIDDRTRDKAAALYYAEGVARLWQMGAVPAAVVLRQVQGQAGTVDTLEMSYSITPAGTAEDMGADGATSHGAMERATVTVIYTPVGGEMSGVSLEVLRPQANHR